MIVAETDPFDPFVFTLPNGSFQGPKKKSILFVREKYEQETLRNRLILSCRRQN